MTLVVMKMSFLRGKDNHHQELKAYDSSVQVVTFLTTWTLLSLHKIRP